MNSRIAIMINTSDTVVGYCRIYVLASANAINYNDTEYCSIMDILSNQKIFANYCNENTAPRSTGHLAELPACWYDDAPANLSGDKFTHCSKCRFWISSSRIRLGVCGPGRGSLHI